MVESRIIRKGILTILVATVVGIRAREINKNEHKKICDALKVSVGLWKMVQSKEWNPSIALASALGQAIFGNERGGNLEDLKETLPQAYVNPGHRGQWCGSCSHSGTHYPGISIPHDIMCLCSPGRCEEPFHYHYSDSYGCTLRWSWRTLCGKGHDDLGNEYSRGWFSMKSPAKIKQSTGNHTGYLQIPWKETVWGCIKDVLKISEKTHKTLEAQLNILNKTLQDFEKILKGRHTGMHKLGGTDKDTEDYASDEFTFHVRYGSCGDASHGGESKKPWWKKLLEGLTKSSNASREETEAFFNSASAGSTAGYYGGHYQHQQGHATPDGGPTPAGKRPSTTQGNGTQTQESTNITMGTHADGNYTAPRLEMLRSSTRITPPPSWLLNAAFLV
ncbi:Variant surface glycoprotein [Trypanosoma congolense IL3000]|uniref:Variant surface glycoprotein n=1 Tax=Trypanosoma congolense (strain IL3000) TaxID=1068625 RepID=F9W7K4_TRYCI|nr:Variant surface glycoprotein [Trypanosoma congolense IL3000]